MLGAEDSSGTLRGSVRGVDGAPEDSSGILRGSFGGVDGVPEDSSGALPDLVFGDELAFSGDLGPLVASIATDDATCP